EIETIKLSDSLYAMKGAGGNLALCVGDDAVFLVDDQYAPLTEKINAAIAKVTPKPVKFILNTHWHLDHTGGNENYGKAGVLIVAGHGPPVSGKAELSAYRDMLATLSARIKRMLGEGRKLEEITASNLSADFDERWGKGSIKGPKFVEMLTIGFIKRSP